MCMLNSSFTFHPQHPGDTSLVGKKASLKHPTSKRSLPPQKKKEAFHSFNHTYSSTKCHQKKMLHPNPPTQNLCKTMGKIFPKIFLSADNTSVCWWPNPGSTPGSSSNFCGRSWGIFSWWRWDGMVKVGWVLVVFFGGKRWWWYLASWFPMSQKTHPSIYRTPIQVIQRDPRHFFLNKLELLVWKKIPPPPKKKKESTSSKEDLNTITKQNTYGFPHEIDFNQSLFDPPKIHPKPPNRPPFTRLKRGFPPRPPQWVATFLVHRQVAADVEDQNHQHQPIFSSPRETKPPRCSWSRNTWNVWKVKRFGLWKKNGSKNVTPPKINMEPENGPLEKEIPIGNHHFQVLC